LWAARSGSPSLAGAFASIPASMSMINVLSGGLFDSSDLTPHGVCLL
jgi:hypothetical protein